VAPQFQSNFSCKLHSKIGTALRAFGSRRRYVGWLFSLVNQPGHSLSLSVSMVPIAATASCLITGAEWLYRHLARLPMIATT